MDMSAVGEYSDSLVFDFGIVPSTVDVNNYCTNTAFTDDNKCTSFIKSTKLTDDITSKCQGKSTCTLTSLSDYVDTSATGFNADACSGEFA